MERRRVESLVTGRKGGGKVRKGEGESAERGEGNEGRTKSDDKSVDGGSCDGKELVEGSSESLTGEKEEQGGGVIVIMDESPARRTRSRSKDKAVKEGVTCVSPQTQDV